MNPRHWYWKAYFFLMTAVTLAAITFAFFPPSESTDYDLLVDWAAVPLYVVQLVGLFGFVYERRIVRPLLWRLVFVASVFELLWTLYSLLADLDDAAESYWSVLGAISLAIVVMTVPMLIALYRYGFRSPELWARQ